MSIADNLFSLNRDLEELASRGFGHADAQAITGRMRVAMDQIGAEAGGPPPEADPVQVQLSRLNAGVAALAEAVGPVLQRQKDVGDEIGILSASVARLSESFDTWTAKQAPVAP